MHGLDKLLVVNGPLARQAKSFRDQFRQALPGEDPVSILAAVPLCVNDQIAISGQARGETLQQPSRFLNEIGDDLVEEWNLQSFDPYG